MPEEKRTSPWARPGFVMSAAMMVLFVISLVWVLGGRLLAPAPEVVDGSQAGAASSPGEVAGSTAGPDASVCGLVPGPQQAPSAPFDTDRVALAPGVVLPVTADAGPGLLDGVPRCFAHSPKGALMAAVTFLQVFSSRHGLDEAAEQMLASGPERDRMVASIKAEWDGSTVDPLVVLGFKVKVLGPDECLVTVAAGQPDDTSRMTSWPLQLVWEEGDWKVKTPGNGSWGTEAIAGLSTNGFTPWSV